MQHNYDVLKIDVTSSECFTDT